MKLSLEGNFPGRKFGLPYLIQFFEFRVGGLRIFCRDPAWFRDARCASPRCCAARSAVARTLTLDITTLMSFHRSPKLVSPRRTRQLIVSSDYSLTPRAHECYVSQGEGF